MFFLEHKTQQPPTCPAPPPPHTHTPPLSLLTAPWIAAVCSGWHSAPGGRTFVLYPCVVVPGGGNYRDEQHEGGGPGAMTVSMYCGGNTSRPCIWIPKLCGEQKRFSFFLTFSFFLCTLPQPSLCLSFISHVSVFTHPCICFDSHTVI